MKPENNWKNCYGSADGIHAFCFQWAGEKNDFSRVAGVVQAVMPGFWCGTKTPRPENAASEDDVDLHIIENPDPKTKRAKMWDYEPGDWICISNAGLDLIPAADFEEFWEVV